jgi:histidine triad (HIT) family protein
MSRDCIFCKIINKEIPAEIVYEDETVVAFLDIRPTTKGHTLVIPKTHHEDILNTPDDVLSDLARKIKALSGKLMSALNAAGFNVALNTKPAAGQIVFHTHFHIIPRYSKDELAPWPHHESEPKTRAELAEHIKKFLL